MKDGIVVRCVSIMGGVALLITLAVTGADGDMRTIATAMVAFGIGIGVKSFVDEKLKVKE